MEHRPFHSSCSESDGDVAPLIQQTTHNKRTIQNGKRILLKAIVSKLKGAISPEHGAHKLVVPVIVVPALPALFVVTLEATETLMNSKHYASHSQNTRTVIGRINQTSVLLVRLVHQEIVDPPPSNHCVVKEGKIDGREHKVILLFTLERIILPRSWNAAIGLSSYR